MSIQIFYDDDSANIDERQYWHKNYQTYDYEFLIGSFINTDEDYQYQGGINLENLEIISNTSPEESPISSHESDSNQDNGESMQH